MDWNDPTARVTFIDTETRRAIAVVEDNRADIRQAVAQHALKTESPIEAQFAAWFNVARGHKLALGRARFALQLRPQAWLETAGARYRLDFVLEPMDDWLRGALQSEHLELKVGIELDGHDYHEKTRAQVTARNQRDRDLAAAKWTILHFSGAELHRNPMAAVIEALVAGADALDQAKAALIHG